MKKLKGMTLIEVIVSLFIYALLGLLLMEIMSVVNTTMRSTNQLNQRLSFEAKFADNQIVTQAAPDGGGVVNISYGANGFTEATRTGAIGRTVNYRGWVARYTNPTLNGTTDFSEDINFRFITYSTAALTDQFPGYAFNMHLMIVPFLFRDGLDAAGMANAQTAANNFMSRISRIEVTALDSAGNNHLIDEAALNPNPQLQTAPIYWPTNTRVLASTAAEMAAIVNMEDAANPGSFSRQGTPMLDFAIENLTDPTTETRVQVSNDERNAAESNGRGYSVVVSFIDDNTIDPNTNQPLVRLSVTIPRVYMYVSRGTTESYYSHSMAVIDLNMINAATQAQRDRAIIVCRSNNNGSFDLTEFDV